MVQIQILPRKFEQNLARSMPPAARKIVHRIARDFNRRFPQGNLEKRVEYAHAAMYMQLYQRFGTHTSEFADYAHDALDSLLAGQPVGRFSRSALPAS